MTGWWATARCVFGREVGMLRRRRGAMAGIVLFAVALLLVGQVAFDPNPQETLSLLPGLVWVAGLLASGLGLARLWDAEGDPALRDAVLATPADRGGLVLGKALWGALLSFMVFLGTFGAAWFFFSPRFPTPHLAGVVLALFLGAVGLGALGALFGALAVGLPTRDLLLPLLLYPAVVPLLLGGVNLTAEALAGAAPAGAWLKVMAVFDLVALLAAVGLGEAALES